MGNWKKKVNSYDGFIKKMSVTIIDYKVGNIGSLISMLSRINIHSEASNEVYQEIENNTSGYYQKRYEKIKSVNSRSIINNFAFHLSYPLTIIIRNIVLKYLTKNKRFLENYLGKIYKN